MTDFKPDCIINLHVESLDKSGRLAWACSVVHHKRGRIVMASRKSGNVAREDVEGEALLFGLRQCARLLQEKVEVAANFPLKGIVGAPTGGGAKAGRSRGTGVKLREEITKAWEGFRLTRLANLTGEEAELLCKEAKRA